MLLRGVSNERTAGHAQVKMVTGDQRLIAVETSRRLGLGTNIMEGAELMQGEITDADLATKVCSSLIIDYGISSESVDSLSVWSTRYFVNVFDQRSFWYFPVV